MVNAVYSGIISLVQNVNEPLLEYLPPANEVWGKVIFLHLSVILFTGGGCLLPGGCLVETPPGTATAAGGTHPAGMHSCLYCS